jgi:hypothetical protein
MILKMHGEVINPAPTWQQGSDGEITCTQCNYTVGHNISYMVGREGCTIECGVREKRATVAEDYKSNGVLKRKSLPGGWNWDKYGRRYERWVVHHRSQVLKTPEFLAIDAAQWEALAQERCAHPQRGPLPELEVIRQAMEGRGRPIGYSRADVAYEERHGRYWVHWYRVNVDGSIQLPKYYDELDEGEVCDTEQEAREVLQARAEHDRLRAIEANNEFGGKPYSYPRGYDNLPAYIIPMEPTDAPVRFVGP